MGVQYGCIIKCNSIGNVLLSNTENAFLLIVENELLMVAAQHLACLQSGGPYFCCVPTLPFMLLPVPSWRHVAYVSPVVKALSACLWFVVEIYNS